MLSHLGLAGKLGKPARRATCSHLRTSVHLQLTHQEPGLPWHANVLLAPGEKEALKHKVRRVRPQAQDINSWKIMQVVRNLACLVAEHLSRC